MYGKVIDVSKYQGNIDFNKVKAAGYKGAIIRLGYRGYGKAGTIVLDPYFTTNVEKCKKAGLPFGIYFFSQATTIAEAVEEVAFVCTWINNVNAVPDFPVYIDSEYGNSHRTGRADKLTKAVRTQIVKEFCGGMEKKGFYTGIYASTSWLNNQLDMNVLKDYDVWVAHYASKCGYTGAYGMWQYTSSASVDGVSGRCDCSYCYKNYPHIIQSNALNGHKRPVPKYDVTIFGVTEGDKNAIVNLTAELGVNCTVQEDR